MTLDPKNFGLMINQYHLYQYHRQYRELSRMSEQTVNNSANAEAIDLEKALAEWQEKGNTSTLHALIEEPAGPLRAIGRATLLKILCAMTDRNFSGAEKILAAEPQSRV